MIEYVIELYDTINTKGWPEELIFGGFNDEPIPSINLNCASKKEHFPEIERFIRTVKERVRSALSTIPFKIISKLMIVHLVASAIF